MYAKHGNLGRPFIHNLNKMPDNVAILTGAGFSKDWGGFLVKEMTYLIYSSKKLDSRSTKYEKKICDKIRGDLAFSENYETVLGAYRWFRQRGKMHPLEIELTEALDEAYEFQEQLLMRNAHLEPRLDMFMKQFLVPLIKRQNGKLRFFTLNHDLLLERKMHNSSTCRLIQPHVRPFDPQLPLMVDSFTCDADDQPLPDSAEVPSFQYIKLHGSYNWVNRKNGSKVMITGGEKEAQISEKEGSAGDMIREYWRSFEEAVQDRATVLTIGYSFGDAHVNRVLAKPGVRIININPSGMPSATSEKSQLWANTKGVWSMRFVDVVGADGMPPGQAQEKIRKLLEQTRDF